jgi:hypothetical protein
MNKEAKMKVFVLGMLLMCICVECNAWEHKKTGEFLQKKINYCPNCGTQLFQDSYNINNRFSEGDIIIGPGNKYRKLSRRKVLMVNKNIDACDVDGCGNPRIYVVSTNDAHYEIWGARSEWELRRYYKEHSQ